MRITVLMTWPGVTRGQYDALRTMVNWERDPPAGVILHVASFTDGGLRISDVWESREHFQQFMQTRMRAAVEKLGLTDEPFIDVASTHAIFAPGLGARTITLPAEDLAPPLDVSGDGPGVA